MICGLAFALLPLAACTGENPVDVLVDGAPNAAVVDAAPVADLRVEAATDSTVTLGWTQVDDGTGDPARYRLKYAIPTIDWKSAEIGCDRTMVGTQIGASTSCTVTGLPPETTYDFQLMSFRTRRGQWRGAVYSNVATGATTGGEPGDAGEVLDLEVVGATESTLAVRWTEVGDGTGEPARYRVKFAEPNIDWSSAEVACDVTGGQVGGEASCEVAGLTDETTYDVQLMSYRLVDGAWQGAVYSNVATGSTESGAPGDAERVLDLEVVGATESTLAVRWSEVDDGAGEAARYRVKFAEPNIDWSTAQTACDVTGGQVGSEASCEITGLTDATSYDVQLMSYRVVDGAWQGAVYSNVATGRTSEPAPPASGTSGIWMSDAEIQALPTSGGAWQNVLSEAGGSCGSVDLTDQNQTTNVCVMAKALVFARTGDSRYRTDVVSAITQIVTAPVYSGRALSLGRELGAYVIAAELIDLGSFDPVLDGLFRAALVTLRTTPTSGAASSLIDCHERRPNNWGAHCGATRLAIAVYLGDTADLERAAMVFKGYVGDRSAYAGFSYGDLSWQCDPSRPVGINPVGCVRDGLSLDGVLPDDQRRGGTFTTSPPRENYVWEALQGLMAQAVILERAGYPAFEWEDRALLRAVQWLHGVVDYAAEGDDTWQPHVVNHYYGTSFPAPVPARAGKNVGWTDWTHD